MWWKLVWCPCHFSKVPPASSAELLFHQFGQQCSSANCSESLVASSHANGNGAGGSEHVPWASWKCWAEQGQEEESSPAEPHPGEFGRSRLLLRVAVRVLFLHLVLTARMSFLFELPVPEDRNQVVPASAPPSCHLNGHGVGTVNWWAVLRLSW